jgi:hypothetical protein
MGCAWSVKMQQTKTAKAAIERAQNESVRFAECEQARPQVNVIRIFFIDVKVYLFFLYSRFSARKVTK